MYVCIYYNNFSVSLNYTPDLPIKESLISTENPFSNKRAPISSTFSDCRPLLAIL